jgi:hypothetical protein
MPNLTITRSGALSGPPVSPPPEVPTVVLNPRNPQYCKEAVSGVFKMDGVEYIRKRDKARKGEPGRKEKSECWRWGVKILRLSDQRPFYYCFECEDKGDEQLLPSCDGTTAARNHMKNVHCRDPETGLFIVATPKEVDKDASNEVVIKRSNKAFIAHLVRWFVCCQIAFFMLENLYFREMVTYLNAALGALLVKSRAVLRRWIIQEYERRKANLKAELAVSHSKIHLSFDIWTASNWIAVISIWAYWVNDNGRQRRLLAFRRIYRSHSGDNQAATILEVLKEYQISAKDVGWFVGDNATSNDGAVTIVLKRLWPGITTKQIQARRLRCLGHIINVAASSVLDPSLPELRTAITELEMDQSIVEDVAREKVSWQSKGPLGKLHRLVKYILASPQRREEFGDISGGRKVKEFDHLGVSRFLSNCARWIIDFEVRARESGAAKRGSCRTNQRA